MAVTVGVISHIIPAREMSQDRVQRLIDATSERMLDLAVNKGLASSREGLVIRDTRPDEDLGLAPTTAGVPLAAVRSWWTGALVAATLSRYWNALGLTPQLDTRRLVAFVGVSIPDANPTIQEVAFREGLTGSTTRAAYNLQQLYEELETIGYFSMPVIYEPNQFVFVEFWPRLAKAGGENIVFRALTCEARGPVVS